MTEPLYIEFMKQTVNAVVERWDPTFMKRLIIQTDNAGAHGGGRRGIQNSTLVKLEKWAKQEHKNIRIYFLAQPFRSPDLNALDLGAWNCLQAQQRVNFFQMGNGVAVTRKWQEELEKQCLESWKNWQSDTKLRSLFETLARVQHIIDVCKGGNNFQIPHHNQTDEQVIHSVSAHDDTSEETEDESEEEQQQQTNEERANDGEDKEENSDMFESHKDLESANEGSRASALEDSLDASDVDV